MMQGEIAPSEIEAVLARGLSDPAAGYVALRDPQGAERLAVELARRCEDHRPTCLLVWERPHDLVLAYGVARAMGIVAVRAYNSDGLADFEGSFPDDGGRVMLIADTFGSAEAVRAMRAVAEQQGQQVVAAAALRDVGGPGREELDDTRIPLIALVDQVPDEAERSNG